MSDGNRGKRRVRVRASDSGAFFAAGLARWFRAHGRHGLPWRGGARGGRSRGYRILVTEKLLQRTQASQVAGVYRGFFAAYPTVEALAAADIRGLRRMLRPLGLWKTRARDLKRMAAALVERHGGEVPRSAGELLGLPGVGRYVAAATLCFAFGAREPIVDTNVRRVVGRAFLWGRAAGDGDVARAALAAMPAGRGQPERFKRFNWALLDFAAAVCSPAPRCGTCFMRGRCGMALARGASPTAKKR